MDDPSGNPLAGFALSHSSVSQPKALIGRRVSAAEIETARTERGGWSKATLEAWGVPWPPPKGWRRALERGE